MDKIACCEKPVRVQIRLQLRFNTSARLCQVLDTVHYTTQFGGTEKVNQGEQ